MATINLLPGAKKHFRIPKKEKPKDPPKLAKISIPLWPPAAAISFLLLIWITLFLQAKFKEITLRSLNEKNLNLKTVFLELDILKKKKDELNNKLSFYQNTFQNKFNWAEKLSLIRQVIPAHLWLTSIYTETKAGKTLIIKGSATSTVESEIITSISEFVDRLKKEPSFSKNFEEIKLGPMISEKKGNLNVMNFSLSCKFQ